MRLGDKVEKVTSKLGIEPCSGCMERKSALNEASRRGFLKGSVFMAGYMMFSAKKALAHTIVKPDSDNNKGLWSVRKVNMIEADLFLKDGAYAYGDYAAVVAGLDDIKNNHAPHDKGESGEWGRSLTPHDGNHLMPGMLWSFHLHQKDEYSVVVTFATPENGKYVSYSSDYLGVIYRSENEVIPQAKDFHRAADIPNSYPFDQAPVTEDRQTWFGRFLSRLGMSSVVYAACINCCACCATNGGICAAVARPGCFNCGSSYCPWCCGFGCGECCVVAQICNGCYACVRCGCIPPAKPAQ